MPARRLFAVVEDSTGIEATGIRAASAEQALYFYHAEALGFDAVQLRVDGLWFRRPADRRLCAGVWLVTETAADGYAAAPPVVFKIAAEP
jgi:hypothetical protein